MYILFILFLIISIFVIVVINKSETAVLANGTTISNKKEDGTYKNMYLAVNFRKGTEIENKTKINILDSFMSFYKDKNGLSRLKIVVMEFERVGQALNNETVLGPDELPF